MAIQVTLVIFGIFLAIGLVNSYYFNMINDWKEFKIKYNKEYECKHAEWKSLMKFFKNWLIIENHNRKYEEGKVSFKLSINHLADGDPQDRLLFIHKMNTTTLKNRNNNEANVYSTPANVKIPEYFNWTAEGAVTYVKNQEFCRSGWAFAATGALEGQLYRLTNKLLSLSEQNLIDCSWDYGNNGCEDGWTEYAYEYVRDNKGIDTEESYPYDGEEWFCRYNATFRGTANKGYTIIPSGDEIKLMEAVATVGPIAVAINADDRGFQLYKEGIYIGKPCTEGECINHAVLVVGYGVDEKTGLDYWLVKNSWGKYWGEGGHIRMIRNRKNANCIASFASFPLL